jgi:hypothetical protein
VVVKEVAVAAPVMVGVVFAEEDTVSSSNRSFGLLPDVPEAE